MTFSHVSQQVLLSSPHYLIKNWCEREDLNLQPLRDMILSHARMPIPPRSHIGSYYPTKISRLMRCCQKLGILIEIGAMVNKIFMAAFLLRKLPGLLTSHSEKAKQSVIISPSQGFPNPRQITEANFSESPFHFRLLVLAEKTLHRNRFACLHG